MCTVQYQQIVIMQLVWIARITTCKFTTMYITCVRAYKQKIKLKDWKYQVFESFQDDNSPKTPDRVTLTFLQL